MLSIECGIRDLQVQLGLSPALCAEAESVAAETGYPLAVTASFVRRIVNYADKSGVTKNPLFVQIFPSASELNNPPHFTPNPLKEQVPAPDGTPASRLLHKYYGRALLLVTPRCFGNCRFCFRRHTFRSQVSENGKFAQEFAQIAQDSTLSEIILSGGDPLAVPDKILETLTENLFKIPHVKRIRIHTRAPIFAPGRITEPLTCRLAEITQNAQKTLTFVLHVNHPAELDDPKVHESVQKLRKTGAIMLQQAVLLRGVNDNADTLAALCESLISLGVTPYYLHQLDQVAGASHFEVDVKGGQKLISELKNRLPGYAIPRYVREVPEMPAKVPAAPE